MPDDGEARAALFAEYRRTGDRATRDRLIETNLGLADSIARRFSGRGKTDDDLRQVTLLGLLKAVERFDPDRGLAFSSFASPTIEGEIKRHFRDHRWAVRVPRRTQEQALEVTAAIATLTQRMGRSPTIEELAAETKLTDEEVIEALEAGRAATAARIDGGDTDDRSIADSLGEHDVGLEDVERRMVVTQLLASLKPRERTIVVLRFYQGLTQSKIAKQLGVSQVHVSRILATALDRLRVVADQARR